MPWNCWNGVQRPRPRIGPAPAPAAPISRPRALGQTVATAGGGTFAQEHSQPSGASGSPSGSKAQKTWVPSGRRGQIPILLLLFLFSSSSPSLRSIPNNYVENHPDAPTGPGLLWAFAPTGTPTAPRRTPTARTRDLLVRLVLFGPGVSTAQRDARVHIEPLTAPRRPPGGHLVTGGGI